MGAGRVARPRVGLLAGVVVAALALLAVPTTVEATTDDVGAGPGIRLRLETVDLDPDGTTTATIQVAGLDPEAPFDPADIRIVENGEPVEGVSVAESEITGSLGTVPAVVLAIDTSGSTEGEPIDAAKAAATALVRDVTANGAVVGVVAFAEDTTTIAPLGATADEAVDAITELEAGGETALFDGVSRAVRIAAQHDGPQDVLVFSDGVDSVSTGTLDDVRALLSGVDVRVTTVNLVVDEPVPELGAMAEVSGGRAIEVTSVDELAGAFQAVSADIGNRVTLTWQVEPTVTRTPQLNVVASYDGPSGSASDGLLVDNPRLVLITPPREVPPPTVIVPAAVGTTSLVVGVAALAVAVFLLSFIIIAGASQRRRESRLDERLAVYERGATTPAETAVRTRSLSSRAADVFDVIPRPTTLDARLAAKIERADWPIRVGELLLIVAGAALAFAIIIVAVSGSIILGLGGLLIGGAAPFVALQTAVSRRQRAFADQLPDVLQVLGGALRAGHAFSTAVEGAVGEVAEPAASELRRATVEARLGRPMELALLGVADRTDSEDLTWVVSALQVQREVGGNLAEVLDNVSGTLRARASIRRQVRALSAEGRLSATIISIMPFGMFIALSLLSPDYVSLLFERTIGRLLIGIALVMLAGGILWLRKIVEPKF